MSRPVVLGCLLLAACEPVLLAADESKGVAGQQAQSAAVDNVGGDDTDTGVGGASDGSEPSSPTAAAAAPPNVKVDESSPQVQLSVKSVDCGSCYDLEATASGGVPPYRYEWDNSASSGTRRVCLSSTDFAMVWVIVEDSTGSRSNAYVTHLQANADDSAACSGGTGASSANVPMCLMNGSFEGTAQINSGAAFDAQPWTTCRDASDATGNTPDIANASLDPVMSGTAPEPTAGKTYVAMMSNEQVSQKLCQPLNAGDKTFLKLDARLIELGGGDMFVQIWGGTSADCMTRRLLWVSPALTSNWDTYCVPLQPGEYMDMITLRANQPVTGFINVAAIDNLLPVDSCP